jgi:RNA 2',3'-cyclic 3'-phosphodiesterase
MKRLFAAITIHPSVRFTNLYNEITFSLRHERIKWVEPANIHLTIKFFGETDEKRIPEIIQALETTATKSDPFSLKIENTGIFGSRYDPKVVWFGIKQNDHLEKLAGNLFVELEKDGWPKDRQNFVPHLTLGRIRELKDKPLFQQIISRYQSLEIQEESVTELILYESILHREGPLYVKVFAAKLQ